MRFDQPRLVTLFLLARRPAERGPLLTLSLLGSRQAARTEFEEFGYLDLKAVAVAGQHLRCG